MRDPFVKEIYDEIHVAERDVYIGRSFLLRVMYRDTFGRLMSVREIQYQVVKFRDMTIC